EGSGGAWCRGTAPGQRVRLARQPTHLPPVLPRPFSPARPRPPQRSAPSGSAPGYYQRRPTPLRTPDALVDHQVDGVPFRRVLPVDTLLLSNSVRKSEGANFCTCISLYVYQTEQKARSGELRARSERDAYWVSTRCLRDVYVRGEAGNVLLSHGA